MVALPDVPQMPDIRRQLADAVATITADRRYTDTGKRNAIAHAYRAARREVEALITQYETTVKTQRRALERDLFGLTDTKDPVALISWRDAQDRADALDSEQAAIRAFDRARNSGDTHLAKAVLQRATRSSWLDIIHGADEILPGSGDKLRELEQLPSDKSFNLIRSTVFKLDTPRELDGVHASALEQWADEHQPPASPPARGHAVASESIPATAPGGSIGEQAWDPVTGTAPHHVY
ncbi:MULTISPECIES: hypothetical protein [Nocardia]|uniref:hypothetical protein n=1 Tax=Nocardia TaxID=1817 RepID=UPI00245844AB|nr:MULTISPECIES: hypothetical protein [Nocardia]